MRFSFLPKWIVHRVTELSPALLQSSGIQLLMLDFDNTIVPYTTDVPSEEMLCWLREIQSSQMLLCVVSNSKKDRVPQFCRQYGIDCLTHAQKPFGGGIRTCLRRYGLPPEACALAGDQIFTDVLGANCAGVRSVLVTPIQLHNIWLKLRHIAELPFIFLAKGRRIST